MNRKLYENNISIFAFNPSSPEQLLGKRLGLDRTSSINDDSRGIFNETRWRFLRKQLTAERRSLFLHKALS